MHACHVELRRSTKIDRMVSTYVHSPTSRTFYGTDFRRWRTNSQKRNTTTTTMQGATQRRTSKAVRESPLSSELPPLLMQPVPTATVKRRKCGTSPFDHHWLNLDCCGLFCAVLTYGLHVYGCYAVCWLLIPPWMSTMEGEVRHLSLAGRFHMFGFVSIAAMAILSHFKAMTTDPGAVPPDAKPLPDPQDLEKGETTGESAAHKGKRLCRRCHAFKPPRAHHCRYVTVSN